MTIVSVQEAKLHPDMLVYSASKVAQTNMVQSLSLQLVADRITVNNVAPGVIYTDRNVEALSDLLCSEQGRYITGQSIYIDGGKSVQ